MKLSILGRFAGVLAVTAGLAGCMDVDSQIEVLSETTGKVTTSMVMSAEFYPMLKQMSQAGGQGAEGSEFCEEEGATLTENADGSATCLTSVEGSFADFAEVDGPTEDMSFTVVSPGVVRVAFKTNEVKNQISEGAGGGGQSAEQAQAMAMIKPYFEGHNIVIRVKGKRITETNMTQSGDGKSAETTISFTDLLEGKSDIPDELFAVVDTR